MRLIKRVGKVFLIIISVLAIAWCCLYIYAKFFYNQEVEVEKIYMSEIPVEPSDFLADFEEIHHLVLDHYSLYKTKQLNMDSLHQVFYSRLQDGVKSKKEYGLLLQEYFALLKVGHAFVFFMNYTANYTPLFINNSLYLNDPNDYLNAYGFLDKDQIIGINGCSLKEWLDENLKYTPASTCQSKRLLTALRAFRSPTDTLRNYIVLRGDDTLSIELPLQPFDYFPEVKQEIVEYKILQDSIGYIAIHSMMNDVVDDFIKAYNKVKDYPYLVIDVRQNGGGNSGNGLEICEYLINKEQPHCVDPQYIMKPKTDAFQGAIYALTSRYTFSAAESFVLDLRESGKVILVGDCTAGDTGNRPRTFKTKQGVAFRVPTKNAAISPKGFPMEGEGIPPHHFVLQSVPDFMKDVDTQLEYVLQLISKGN